MEALKEWERERGLDLALRSTPKAPHGWAGDAWTTTLHRQPDQEVLVGEVRLLPSSLTSEGRQLVYVLVLQLEDELALVAPFSPYAHPGVRGELATGLEGAPLRVLQLWNTVPAPLSALAESWVANRVGDGLLNEAMVVYRGFNSGMAIPHEIRNRTGLPVHDLGDPRLLYMAEEQELLSPLRARMVEELF